MVFGGVGQNASFDSSVEGRGVLESGYPGINRRAGYPDYNSGSELECGPGTGVVWVGMG